ncbi:MAG: formate dehydrogenase [Thermodesulfobacteriota bacterium]|nr:formate dehydrogenase [Thermodesulfobacteriota bacterium]
MPATYILSVEKKDVQLALRNFFSSVLRLDDIGSILVPMRLSANNSVKPVLVSDPGHLEGADPLAPAFPINSAKILSSLTRKSAGCKIAAVLRPCEIRAFVELVKLRQASPDEVIIISADCLGAYTNSDYKRFVSDKKERSTPVFLEMMLSGEKKADAEKGLSAACRVCEQSIPERADIRIGIVGVNINEQLLVHALTPAGEEICTSLGLTSGQEPRERQEAINSVIAQRKVFRDGMFDKTEKATNSIGKLTEYFADCVNCYNCRVACPVCYCRECVFSTDVFSHEPYQYLQWAERKGAVKMPADTLFYHLTRLAHMSTACVGCGQCSNACPNEIPVMELFRTIAYKTQKAFMYEAGRSPDEPPPLSVFREDEFAEVVGIRE